ncbi:MAG TPA: (4Fe-4S)-binding protein [Bacteroidales bacterium]|nr:(4Fe-4S)-binding protein [Bacteroidales bacterium]
MKEIVVISGKGGTGKTSLSASFAFLSGSEAIIADCDVDAADMHLLMSPDFAHNEDFYSGQMASIDNEVCTSCGLCLEKCRFDAIETDGERYQVKELDCEGCGYCERICPVGAISMKEQKAGQFYISGTRMKNTLVHARLRAGAENSGKLVAKVKKEAKRLAEQENKKYVIADGSPGIGCPVISSLSGADYVVIVTEPTVSGLHDLKRVYELVKKFDIKTSCIINKHDLNPEITNRIMDFIDSESVVHLCNIPYSNTFTDAITRGITVLENGDTEMIKVIKNAWETIKKSINDK